MVTIAMDISAGSTGNVPGERKYSEAVSARPIGASIIQTQFDTSLDLISETVAYANDANRAINLR